YRLAAGFGVGPQLSLPSPAPRWERALLEDLRAHVGRCLIVAADAQPPAVHALTHALNERLGRPGTTHEYVEPLVYQRADGSRSLEALVNAARSGAVKLLLILGGNPVYDAPADLEFADALRR